MESTGTGPEDAAVDRTRAALAALGADPDSAPDVPPEVTARITTALHNAHTVAAPPRSDTPAHAARPRTHPARLLAACCGLAAVAALIAVGTAALLRGSGTTPSAPISANRITVAPKVPLSAAQLAGLVNRSPEFGPLSDPKRRAACLSALGYPGDQPVLGAAQVQLAGRPAIVLVLPGDRAADLVALAVAPNCSAVSSALIAQTTVTRP